LVIVVAHQVAAYKPMINKDKLAVQQGFIILKRSFNEFTGNSTTLPAIEFHLL